MLSVLVTYVTNLSLLSVWHYVYTTNAVCLCSVNMPMSAYFNRTQSPPWHYSYDFAVWSLCGLKSWWGYQSSVRWHCNAVIMSAMASQITSLTIVYSTVYLGANQRKHQSSASLDFVWGIYQWPVNSPHKWPVTRKCFHLMTSSWYLCSEKMGYAGVF